MQISGQDYPSADGLNNITLTEMKYYTENVDGVSVGDDTASYGSYRFYTVMDYTGHQNIFITPQINTDAGEKVNSRLVQLATRFRTTPQLASQAHCYVFHYGK